MTNEPKAPHPLDLHIGNRLREFRLSRGLTQLDLAKEVGVTFQQIQKYERGSNRIGASRLFELGRVLGVSVNNFFDGFEDESENEPMIDPEVLDLVRGYGRIGDSSVRRGLFEVVKSIVAVDPDDDVPVGPEPAPAD